MKYDQTDIPAAYDRGRDHGPAVLELWMDAVAASARETTVSRILDLGCGTGRFSQALASRFEAEVIALDPSEKMLAQARAKAHDGRVRYERGNAENIPLDAGSVDVVFMSMSYHHFEDAALAARECRRVLRAGGFAFLRTGTRERIFTYPYVPFFPSSWPILEEMLPDLASIRAVFGAAGFQVVSEEIVAQTIAPTWAAFVEKTASGADSVISRLTPEALHEGLEEIRRHASRVDPESVVELIDVLVFR